MVNVFVGLLARHKTNHEPPPVVVMTILVTSRQRRRAGVLDGMGWRPNKRARLSVFLKWIFRVQPLDVDTTAPRGILLPRCVYLGSMNKTAIEMGRAIQCGHGRSRGSRPPEVLVVAVWAVMCAL